MEFSIVSLVVHVSESFFDLSDCFFGKDLSDFAILQLAMRDEETALGLAGKPEADDIVALADKAAGDDATAFDLAGKSLGDDSLAIAIKPASDGTFAFD